MSNDISSGVLESVDKHLKIMGYKLLPYGVGVAYLMIQSGYNEVETASRIALITLALDLKGAGSDIRKLASFVPHGSALMRVLTEYKDLKMMNPTQWQQDSRAVLGVIMANEEQLQWIDDVSSDPITNNERLAVSIIEYEEIAD